MAQSTFEKTGEQIADTVHKASRAASAAAEAIEDGIGTARRAAKRGGYAAEELLHDARRRIQRYPIETIVATFAAGIVAGSALSWLMRHNAACDRADAREAD